MKEKVVLVIIVLLIVSGAYFFITPTLIEKQIKIWEAAHAPAGQLFNKAGLRFQIPPHIFKTEYHSPEDGYLKYSFYTEGNVLSDTSSVGIFIPLAKSPEVNEDPIGSVPNDAIWKMNNWNVLQGDRYVYNVKFSDSMSAWEGSAVKEIYPVAYSELPIVLTYSHSIHDDTLDVFWNNLHNNIRMTLRDNLGSYQAYRIKVCGNLMCKPSPLQNQPSTEVLE